MAKNTATVTQVVAKKGGKSGKTRERRSFWNRALQAPKVREALSSLNVTEKAFEDAYSKTRKVRETRDISPAEIVALQGFREHRNLDKLASDIGKSVVTATMLLGRAMAQNLI